MKKDTQSGLCFIIRLYFADELFCVRVLSPKFYFWPGCNLTLNCNEEALPNVT